MVCKVHADKFDETIREGIWIADFQTNHCPPCRFLEMVLDQVLFDNPTVNLAKCDIDEDPSYVERFQIEGTPTAIFFNDGVEKCSFSGAAGRDTIEECLAKCMYE